MIKRNGPMAIGHKSVEHNGLVYVGGLIATDLSLDMKGQTEQITRKIDDILRDHGTDKHKLLSATIFVTDLSQRPAMNEAWRAWIPGSDLPARATLGVSDLGPNVLIEVTAIAAI